MFLGTQWDIWRFRLWDMTAIEWPIILRKLATYIMTYLLEPPRPRDIGWRISPAISSSHAGTSCFDSTNSSSKSRTKFLFLSLKNDVAVPESKQNKSDQNKPRKSCIPIREILYKCLSSTILHYIIMVKIFISLHNKVKSIVPLDRLTNWHDCWNYLSVDTL